MDDEDQVHCKLDLYTPVIPPEAMGEEQERAAKLEEDEQKNAVSPAERVEQSFEEARAYDTDMTALRHPSKIRPSRTKRCTP